MKKVSVNLGSGTSPVEVLADAPAPRGGTWSSDGFIVFARNIEDSLYRVSASGGEVLPLTTLDRARQENAHRWPQFFPDGQHLLYFARTSMPEYQGIYVGTPKSRHWKLLLRSSMNALVTGPQRPSASAGLFGAQHGYLLFMRERTLLAQRFDLHRMEYVGEPAAIAQSLALSSNRAVFSAAADLILVYRTDNTEKQPFHWFDRTGKPLGSSTTEGASPRLSLDGRQVAFYRPDVSTGGGNVWLEDLTRRVVTRLTSHPAYAWMPIWSPDGNSIVFASNREGTMDLYQKQIAGSESERQILKSDKRKIPTDWSRNGQFILFQQEDPKSKWDLWALPMAGDRKPFPILQSEFNETDGVLSPDGKWLAYTSDETGTAQVYVQHFMSRSAGGQGDKIFRGKWRISTDGGWEPHWQADGKELFYLNARRGIMSAKVRTGQMLDASTPLALFASPVDIKDYDVTPDGRRFLVSPMSWELRGTEPVTVVSDWTQVLKR
jgi:Tol biopolymer transport system component